MHFWYLKYLIISKLKIKFGLFSFPAFVEVGGYQKLIDGYFEARASNRSYVDPSSDTVVLFCDSNKSSDCCGEVQEDSMHLLRSMYPGDSDLPWTGVCKYIYLFQE